jgi:hypothetical protein
LNSRVVAGIFAFAFVGILWGTLSFEPVQDHARELPESANLDSNTDEAPAQSIANRSTPTYVGRETCRECHAENYELHAKHGHANTFRSASAPEVVSKFVGKSYDTEREYGTYTYHANEDGLFARIPERFGEESFPLQYALGSGHLGFTLLSLMPDPKEGTVAIEHRASWYREGDQLGPTPGQVHTKPETLRELFGQEHHGDVMRKCVDCHTTTGTIVDQQIQNLTPSVNCEKCHGPGSLHVQQARNMSKPPPYSVGRSDWNLESEIQLCGDCHRLPAVITRKELREYPNHLARFQPIGMLRSKCFLASDGQFKCTTCHDPHTTLSAATETHFVQTCIDCHLEDSPEHVACPVSPKSDCIDCHMPRVPFDDFGTSFHDHWIRVREN